jgi:hypothetical protein
MTPHRETITQFYSLGTIPSGHRRVDQRSIKAVSIQETALPVTP